MQNVFIQPCHPKVGRYPVEHLTVQDIELCIWDATRTNFLYAWVILRTPGICKSKPVD